MKKERIVGLCICIVLLGSLQSAFFMAAGVKQFRASAYSRAETRTQALNVRSDVLPALVCAGWPPLGFLYGQMHLLNKRMGNLTVRDVRQPVGKELAGHKAVEKLTDYRKLDRKAPEGN